MANTKLAEWSLVFRRRFTHHAAEQAVGRKAMNTWDAKRSQINTLLEELQGKPDNEKFGHWLNPESILNAYREGDLLFTDAVQELKEWAIMYVNRSAPHKRVSFGERSRGVYG